MPNSLNKSVFVSIAFTTATGVLKYYWYLCTCHDTVINTIDIWYEVICTLHGGLSWNPKFMSSWL